MNKAFFIGNLVRDPETKTMSNNKLKATFTIAVNRTYANAQGVREADYIQIICYEKRAELAEKYLAKGRKVAVECVVRTGSYEKDDGSGHKTRVFTTDFIAERMEFLSSAKSETNAEPPKQEQENDYDGYTVVDDDQLPF